MEQKIIIPVLLLVIILGSVYVYVRLPEETAPQNIIKRVTALFEVFAQEQKADESESSEEITQETIKKTGGGSEGGGGGGGSQGSAGQEQTCVEQPIPYALRKPLTEEKCNTFQGQNCIDKTVVCSIETHNLGLSNSGTFEIQTRILDESNQELFLTTESKTIESNSLELFTVAAQFTNPQEAQQELRCSFNTLSVPTEQFCS